MKGCLLRPVSGNHILGSPVFAPEERHVYRLGNLIVKALQRSAMSVSGTLRSAGARNIMKLPMAINMLLLWSKER
jgi:hypothetical protein